jgi:hypothetical protein
MAGKSAEVGGLIFMSNGFTSLFTKNDLFKLAFKYTISGVNNWVLEQSLKHIPT